MRDPPPNEHCQDATPTSRYRVGVDVHEHSTELCRWRWLGKIWGDYYRRHSKLELFTVDVHEIRQAIEDAGLAVFEPNTSFFNL